MQLGNVYVGDCQDLIAEGVELMQSRLCRSTTSSAAGTT